MISIEEKIFKKSKVDFNKLIPYGFKKEKSNYKYYKTILNNGFQIEITIDNNGKVQGKIIELAVNDEYSNFRIENFNGEFVNKVRDEFQNCLLDIKNNCFNEKYFITEQANRIANLIIQKYDNIPEFAWEKFPGYGIFKNLNNKKWYGLIMNINRNKLDKAREDEEIEVINVKLKADKIATLLLKPGFYPAYHMNKKNWITISLDNTLKDEEIMNYIIESHQYTEHSDK